MRRCLARYVLTVSKRETLRLLSVAWHISCLCLVSFVFFAFPLKPRLDFADSSSMLNLSTMLGAKKDKYARKLGDLILGSKVVRIGSARDVFEFVSNLESRFFRVIYRCLDGSIRDMTGRQGVYASKQDGEVQGTGHRMRNEERLNLSFWTDCQGGKVNLGMGKGYRTLKAAGILLLRVQGTDILTDAGIEALRSI